MRILVAGSRSIENKGLVHKYLDQLLSHYNKENITIITGGARGIDKIAKEWADNRGIKNIVMPAEWDVHGKSAGYKRNVRMHEWLADDDERLCLCFWDGKSKGTAHNFELAKKHGTKLIVYKTVA